VSICAIYLSIHDKDYLNSLKNGITHNRADQLTAKGL